jgi:hypothetical protein
MRKTHSLNRLSGLMKYLSLICSLVYLFVRYVINYKSSLLGIPPQIGQHYRQKVLQFWIDYSLVKLNDFLKDEDKCRSLNDTRTSEDMKAGGITSLPKILIIVFGICLLLINLCAYVALFNQRRRLRSQEKLMKRLYADVEMTNTQENLVASESVRRKNNGKTIRQRNGGEQHAIKTEEAEGTERGDCLQNRCKISRQYSESTMDTQAKIRWWFDSVQGQRPRSEIQLTYFHPADQKCSPSRQKNEFEIEEDNTTPGPLISQNYQVQNSSSSVALKPNIKVAITRKKIKKLSVAVDATPSARIASMLWKDVKDDNGCVSRQTPETKLNLKRDSFKKGGNSALLTSHPPNVERTPDKCNSPSNAQACSLPNNCLGGEHCEIGNDVPQTQSLIPTAKAVSSPSGYKNHNVYSKDESSEVTRNNIDALPMTSPKKFQLFVGKNDVGITVTPDLLEPEDVRETSRGSASDADKTLSLLNSLERNCRRNIPGFQSPEQKIVNCYEKLPDTAVVGARRLSLPPHIFWPPVKHTETEVGQDNIYTKREGLNSKFTRLSRRRHPTTTSRKPSNGTHLLPFKKKESPQESTQATNQMSPTFKTITPTEDHPLNLVDRYQEQQHITDSVVTPEEHSAESQNEVQQQMSQTKIRRTEMGTHMQSRQEILIHKKQKSPGKMSVGTSTSSLILSELTSTDMI